MKKASMRLAMKAARKIGKAKNKPLAIHRWADAARKMLGK